MPDDVFDAYLAARERGALPTALDTQGLRNLDAETRAMAVFSARATNVLFVSKIKEVTDQLASGDIGFAEARAALFQTLHAVGYTPEGGFPDAPPGSVPPAIRGTLQDLSSFRRLDLIVRTQLELVQGKGQQLRGHTPERLEAFPAWELIRVGQREVPRDWASRWKIAGGKFYGPENRIIALKGDPAWGELGASGNFDDALDTDHPPFAFQSGMGWREVPRNEVIALGVTGPNGEDFDAWHRDPKNRPGVIAGQLPLPAPSIAMTGADPQLVAQFKKETFATEDPDAPGRYDFSDLLAEELAKADAAYGKPPGTR